MKPVAVAVEPQFADLDANWALLRDALAAEGIEAEAPLWDDAAVDWAGFAVVLPLYTWGYWTRGAEFLAWVQRVAAETTLANPAAVVAWNSDKHYLADLEAAGVPVIPTAFVRPGEPWTAPGPDFVVKPSVGSGGAFAARHVAAGGGLERAGEHVRRLHAAGRTAMVQPYQPSVDAVGETALLYFGGRFSHAARKQGLLAAGAGEVDRLWEREVITAAGARPEQLEVGAAALEAAGAVGGPLTYARVDVVDGPGGEPLLLELELIEPTLFLTLAPPAARTFASVIAVAAAGA